MNNEPYDPRERFLMILFFTGLIAATLLIGYLKGLGWF